MIAAGQAQHSQPSASAGGEKKDEDELSSMLSMSPPGLEDTLEELVETAEEMSEGGDGYAKFAAVGRAVQKLLLLQV